MRCYPKVLKISMKFVSNQMLLVAVNLVLVVYGPVVAGRHFYVVMFVCDWTFAMNSKS